MKEKKNNISKFPKGFFTNIKTSKVVHSKDPEEYDKPFEWSKNVLNGKSKVQIISGTK